MAVPPGRVVIIHGYNATPSSHWFASVAGELEAEGIRVEVAELPNPTSPAVEQWVTTARDVIGDVDERTVIVAHSLGGITTLRALAQRGPGPDLGALVIVAGFDAALPKLRKLDPFTADPLDLASIAARIRQRVVIVSDADEVVDPALSRSLARRLDADLVEIIGGGHFRARDGWIEFPALTRIVRAAV
jgi:hypothetical protein